VLQKYRRAFGERQPWMVSSQDSLVSTPRFHPRNLIRHGISRWSSKFDDPHTADEEYSITVRLFEALLANR
jgi:hypothetical protein